MTSEAPLSAPEDLQIPLQPRSRVWKWLKWVVALGLLALLINWNRNDLNQFGSLQKDWGLIGVAFLFCLVATILTFLRWYLLVLVLDFPFRFRDALRLGFMGQLFIYAGPGLMGADLFKAFFLAKDNPGRRGIAASTVFLDRLLGMLSLFILGAVASLFAPSTGTGIDAPLRWLLWLGSLCGILGVSLLLQPFITQNRLIQKLGTLPKVGRIIMGILNGVVLYQSRPRMILLAILIGIFSHAANFTGMYCCALALGRADEAPSLISHYFLMPAAAFTALLPVPGGIGPQEFVIKELYSLKSGSSALGLWAAIAFRIVNLAISAIGLIYYLPMRRQVDRVIAESAPDDSPSSA